MTDHPALTALHGELVTKRRHLVMDLAKVDDDGQRNLSFIPMLADVQEIATQPFRKLRKSSV